MAEKKPFRLNIKDILTKNWPLILIIVFGVFFRFFKLEPFVTFLGDQGRDAIIVKRILTLEHLPAIGAPTSVGMVYLGPFYYYFITPWLWLFNFNPLGLAVCVAFFSSLYLLINYFAVKEIIDKKTALISTFIISFSWVIIEYSRFSWNPNLQPLFVTLSIYFLYRSVKNNHWWEYALTGGLMALTFQLHYLSAFLIVFGFFYYLITGLKQKRFVKNIRNYVIWGLSFLFFSLPLFVFDLRHDFLNTKNFVKMFTQEKPIADNKISNLIDAFSSLNQYLFQTKINNVILIIVFLTMILSTYFLIKRKNSAGFIFSAFLFLFLGISLYGGQKIPHYFLAVYPLYIMVISFIFSNNLNNKLNVVLTSLFLIAFTILNVQKYTFFFAGPPRQINQAKKVARVIFDNVTKKFTVTSLPERYSDSMYRYFLEVWGKRSIEKDSLERADELFVICETACPLIIGNPQWDVAYFAPNKIVKIWKINNVKIYKLVR